MFQSTLLQPDPFNIDEQLERFTLKFNTLPEETLAVLTTFIKRIMLLKILSQSDELRDNLFLQGIIYDGLYAIKESQENERYFHFNIRSLIENIMRFAIKLENNSNLGVTKLEKQFAELHLECHQKLVTIYSISCNFVHNNALSGLNLETNYSELCDSHHLSIEKQIALLSFLNDISEAISECITAIYPYLATNSFPMNLNVLYKLLDVKYAQKIQTFLDQ